MITRIHLENFKAWKSLDLEFGQLTGVFGTNSSGKSSLFQFLLMLKQTRNATDPAVTLNFGGPHQLVNLGSYRDLIHQHDQNSSLSWKLSWRDAPRLRRHGRRYRLGRIGREYSLESRVGLIQSTPETMHLSYHIDNKWIGIDHVSERPGDGHGYALRNQDGLVTPVRDRPSGRRMEYRVAPAKSYILRIPFWLFRDPDLEDREQHRIMRELRSTPLYYESMIDGISYLGPLRERPHRHYRFGGVRPSDVGVRGERTIDALLSATESGRTLIDGTGRERQFEEMIAYWLREMGLVESFRLERIRQFNLSRALVTARAGGIETALTDVGFGVSQVLPILVLLYYADPGSVILLEQPEIHLHPSAQSVLADVFFHAIRTRDIQIVVESHSEHLLRRIQRRRAEEAEGSADVRLYFVSTGGSGAQLNDLVLDEYGQIRNWPENFFGDELGEVFAIQEAGLRRRMKEQS